MFSVGVFGMSFDSKYRVILCQRRDLDLWNLPGGALEASEAPWDGVALTRVVGIYSKPEQPEQGEIVFSFVCDILGGNPVPTDEADQVEYVALDETPPNASRKQVERIRDALQNPDITVFKEQRGPSSRGKAGQLHRF
ncbi:MAG TPA: hypothetical protein VGR16_14725 [Thermomicrobiales bacterium]|nr:hypothetical protein [Thermomicrobiales bacterium]